MTKRNDQKREDKAKFKEEKARIKAENAKIKDDEARAKKEKNEEKARIREEKAQAKREREEEARVKKENEAKKNISVKRLGDYIAKHTKSAITLNSIMSMNDRKTMSKSTIARDKQKRNDSIKYFTENQKLFNDRYQRLKEHFGEHFDDLTLGGFGTDDDGFKEKLKHNVSILDEIEKLLSLNSNTNPNVTIEGGNPFRVIATNTRDIVQSYKIYKNEKANIIINKNIPTRTPNILDSYEKYKKSLFI